MSICFCIAHASPDSAWKAKKLVIKKKQPLKNKNSDSITFWKSDCISIFKFQVDDNLGIYKTQEVLKYQIRLASETACFQSHVDSVFTLLFYKQC